jgi:hypothetical protein
MTTEDERDALAHQAQLENRRFEEEWQKDYLLWLMALPEWWQALDQDEKWQKDNM